LSVVLGIDTGGTFTDFVLVDRAEQTVRIAKVPSTPRDPGSAISAGLSKLSGLERVDRIVIGTTIATNAVIERRGPRTLLITNSGFEDVPFIGRLDKARLYDLQWKKPAPLINRRDSIGVAGRLDHHGNEVERLEDAELAKLRNRLAEYAGEEIAVAVCCLFSYMNGVHESRVAEAARQALPGAEVSVSHEVSPLWREYERASTTIADAFVKPVVSRYVGRVGEIIDETDLDCRWNLLASNGGYLSAERALARPAQLLLSGLAGGVIGGRHYARAVGEDAAFILDAGGTSSDIGLVRAGSQQYVNEFSIDFGIPVTIPCVAVETIGAGGGSIGWVDKGGMLHVGPRSAGADPGPVAYAKGGVEPTVTDAHLALGRLDAGYFLGGTMPLDHDAARAAIARLGKPLAMEMEKTALAMIRTANENMGNAIRLIAVHYGLDVRDFALIAFGGAGPLHAAPVARLLGMKRVIVPLHPGLCSAFGAAIAEARVDRMQTLPTQSETVDLAVLWSALSRLIEEAKRELLASVPCAAVSLRCSADMRYLGQNYEVEVPLPAAMFNEAAWNETLQRFAVRHEELYGFALPNEPVELINLRVTAFEAEPERAWRLSLPSARFERPSARLVWFESGALERCRILSRAQLGDQGQVAGPAIVEEEDSTILVDGGDSAMLHESGSVIISIGSNQ
jgi:N-methylhydantoinase A